MEVDPGVRPADGGVWHEPVYTFWVGVMSNLDLFPGLGRSARFLVFLLLGLLQESFKCPKASC